VQFVLETPQFAADVQGIHHIVGRDDSLPISSFVSPQNAAIKNHFIISPHSPVRARKTPWENGIFSQAVLVRRGISVSSHALAELDYISDCCGYSFPATFVQSAISK